MRTSWALGGATSMSSMLKALPASHATAAFWFGNKCQRGGGPSRRRGGDFAPSFLVLTLQVMVCRCGFPRVSNTNDVTAGEVGGKLETYFAGSGSHLVVIRYSSGDVRCDVFSIGTDQRSSMYMYLQWWWGYDLMMVVEEEGLLRFLCCSSSAFVRSSRRVPNEG
jgi:hypothetical protein